MPKSQVTWSMPESASPTSAGVKVVAWFDCTARSAPASTVGGVWSSGAETMRSRVPSFWYQTARLSPAAVVPISGMPVAGPITIGADQVPPLRLDA